MAEQLRGAERVSRAQTDYIAKMNQPRCPIDSQYALPIDKLYLMMIRCRLDHQRAPNGGRPITLRRVRRWSDRRERY
jgi:hypothetical protein